MDSSHEPTALSIMQAMLAVLTDSAPKRCDAIFVHGAPVNDPETNDMLLRRVAEYWHKTGCRVVVNGTPARTCKAKSMPYQGFEPTVSRLSYMGVEKSAIVSLGEALHTAAESRALLALAKKMGWTSLVISSFPHHQLRCFLQIVALMSPALRLAVHNHTFGGIPLSRKMYRTILGGGSSASGIPATAGTFADQIESEYRRIVDYMREPPCDAMGAPKYTRHATISQMLEYLEWRDIRT